MSWLAFAGAVETRVLPAVVIASSTYLSARSGVGNRRHPTSRIATCRPDRRDGGYTAKELLMGASFRNDRFVFTAESSGACSQLRQRLYGTDTHGRESPTSGPQFNERPGASVAFQGRSGMTNSDQGPFRS